MKWNRAKIVSWMLLVFTAILAYYNMPATDFIGDDVGRILIKEKVFREGLFHTIENVLSDRPFLMMTIWLNYFFGGMSPVGYKVFNILLHLACGFAVLSLMKEILKKFENGTSYSVAIAALFLSHPINNQAVNSVIQRGAGLSTLFSLLSILALIFYVSRSEKRHYYLLSILAFLLAIASKPNAAILPLIAGLYLVFELKLNWLKTLKLLAPYLVMVLMPAVLHSLFTENVQFNAISGTEYFLVQMRVIAFYFQKYLLPLDLHFYYKFNNNPQQWIDGLTPVFMLAHAGLLVTGGYLYFRRKMIAGLFILLGYLALLPESGFFPIIHTAFDHRNYFPMIFFMAAMVTFTAELFKTSRSVKLFKGLLAAAVVTLCFLNSAYTSKINTHSKWVFYNIDMNPTYRRFYTAAIADEMQKANFEMATALIQKVKAANPSDQEIDFLNELIPFSDQSADVKMETLRKSFEFACSKGLTTDSFYYFEYLLAKNLSTLTIPKDYLYKMNSFYFCFINVVFQPYISNEVAQRVETNFMSVLEINQRLQSSPETFFEGLSTSDAMVALRTLIALNHFRGYGQVNAGQYAEILSTRFKDVGEAQGVLNFIRNLPQAP